MLKQRRLAFRLSQKQLAELIGVEQSYISKLESKKKQPSLEILVKISKELDICMVDLLQQYLCSKCKKQSCNKK